MAVRSELERFLSILNTVLAENNAPGGELPSPGSGTGSAAAPRTPDAIDDALAAAPRATAVTSLMDSPQVQAFRD